MRTLMAILLLAAFMYGCQGEKSESAEAIADSQVFISPLGKELPLPVPGKKMQDQYEQAKQAYEAGSDNVDNIIWYGRRTAYLGRYREAIEIYTRGLEKYPDEPRLYRHRGHRYISLREYAKAIADLTKASELIAGTEDQIEPDGIPNARNIPVSTLHGNIWYHLGLAYYLQHKYKQAFDAYMKARGTSQNMDNIAATTHWLYMIKRRMGEGRVAEEVLEPITNDVDIIENFDYYNLCRFYKGFIPLDSLQPGNTGSPGSDALKYGIANWYLYNGDTTRAREALAEILTGKSWSSFGYIAAESDMLNYFGQ